MIILKHRHESEPKYWKFACHCCGCVWVADETETYDKDYSYPDIFVGCRCPECDDLVYSKCQIDSEEYEKIYNKVFNKVGLQLIKITKEELH